MIFDKLTEQDKEMIQVYIDENIPSWQPCEGKPLSTVLSYWDKNKERLYNLFGKKFIISQKISYEESYDEIEKRIKEKIFDDPNIQMFVNKCRTLFLRFCPWEYDDKEEEKHKKLNSYNNTMRNLVNFDSLTHNKFDPWSDDSKTFEILLQDNSIYKFQRGIKPIKVLKKIAESYNIEGFEEFRNAHSRCLQTKQTKGELCFSIHPLDYMTMSDNNCGWKSCMSWRGCGEYRAGTIEMLNSPCVVVAYLKSAHNHININGQQWNSKKWRCLFIVDDNFILSVKSYPFFNENLLKLAEARLAELIGWGPQEPVKYEYEEYECTGNGLQIGDKIFYITTETGAMYNDFGCTDHYVILNPYNTKTEIGEEYYCYSGPATCMHCGAPMEFYEEGTEGSLSCGDLDEFNYDSCSICGARISNDESYWVGDDCLCYYCYEQEAVYDSFDCCNIYEDEAIEIFLSQSDEKLVLPKGFQNEMSIWVHRNNEGGVCASYARAQYFKENCAEIRYNEENDKYWVSVSQLTERGLRLFDIFDEESLQDYLSYESN